LLALFFNPEDGDMFLSQFSMDYMMLYPRRWKELFIPTAVRSSKPTSILDNLKNLQL
jgi:hypothetical protein